ncbi:MAG: MarR family transcriptional regulator [Streptosporangiales bacterium]|nr:MarR family transcriptional regulator [Streptosporangiales bacterium]
MQRMTAHVLAVFVFTEQAAVTMGDIAGELGVSAGSVSGAIRMLTTVGLIEQVPVPGSRRDHYRMRDGAWATLFTQRNAVARMMVEAAEDGVAATEEGSVAHRRLREMRDFYAFMLREIPELVARWKAERRERTSE